MNIGDKIYYRVNDNLIGDGNITNIIYVLDNGNTIEHKDASVSQQEVVETELTKVQAQKEVILAKEAELLETKAILMESIELTNEPAIEADVPLL